MIKAIIKNIKTGEVTEIEGTPEPIVPSIEEIKRQKLAELNQVLLATRNQGMPFVHNQQTYHFQTRPNSEDRDNWSELADHAQMHLDNEDLKLPMRTAQNVTFMYTPLEVVANVSNIRLFIGACIKAKWQVEETINAQTDKATLEAMDVKETFKQTLQSLISQA